MSAVADEIWAILKENSLQIGRLSESHKEFSESHKEFSESHKKFREEFEISRKETDRIINELREGHKELRREIKAVNDATNKSIGRLTNRLGEFVEEAVRPAAVKLFRERGIDVHEVHQNVNSKRDGEGIEIDLLVINNNDVVAIECKSNLSHDDVNEHLVRLEKVKRLLPDHKNKQIFGAVAGMVIPDNVAAYAIKKGLYVIGQNGDHLELQNQTEFVAKTW